VRVPLVSARPLPRADLLIAAGERDHYLELLEAISRETRPEDTVFALPHNPEIYFLSGRRNPFSFTNSALGLADDDALARAQGTLAEHPPRLVLFNPTDKYGTPRAARLMQTIRARYTLIRTIGELELYRAP
jgi:hypothetical protein